MATYKVKEENLEQVKKLVEDFVEAVQLHESGTIQYQAFHKDNSFVHIMSFTNEQDEKEHKNNQHTKEFVEKLYPNCIAEPHFTDLSLVKMTVRGKDKETL